jgi:protein-tyrosine phosphatase
VVIYDQKGGSNMKKIIDIHSHILPGCDDGCSGKNEALRMLRMYEEQNVEAVICTPHFGPCTITGSNVSDSFLWLKNRSQNVKVYLGNEIHVDYINEANPMPLAGSKHALFEFEDWSYHINEDEMFRGLVAMLKTGYKPILAHPERYRLLQKNHRYYEQITRLGVRLQVNAYDICENEKDDVRNAAQFIINNELASFIGSDAHGAERRSPALSAGVKWIYEHCRENYADAIVHDNAAKIIKEGEA